MHEPRVDNIQILYVFVILKQSELFTNFVTQRFWIPSQNAKRQVLNPILGLQIYAEVDWLAAGGGGGVE